MGLGVLNPTDPGLYRVQRGRLGADALMAPDVGTGGRYMITSGEAATVNGGTSALTSGWRRLLDWNSPGCAVLVLGVLLLLIHASAGVATGASFSARGAVSR